MDTDDSKVVEEKMSEYVLAAKKELEGLLPEKGPFFGGKNIGLAEVRGQDSVVGEVVADCKFYLGFDRAFPFAS